MPRVTDEHRQAMRQRIHDATLRVFTRDGVQRAGMADIIRESGLSAGAIYGYYRSKDELVADVARGIVGGRVNIIREITDTDPPPSPAEAMRRFVAALPPAFVDAGLVLDVWAYATTDTTIHEFTTESFAAFRSAAADYLATYARHCGADAATAEAWGRTAAPLLLAVMQGYVVQRSLVGEQLAGGLLDALDQLPLITWTEHTWTEPTRTGPTRTKPPGDERR